MNNILSALIIATSAQSEACNIVQENVIKKIQEVYAQKPLSIKGCTEGHLLYIDTVIKPFFITIKPDGRILLCKKSGEDIECLGRPGTPEENLQDFLKMYEDKREKLTI